MSTVLPGMVFYASSEPEFFGKFPIRTEMTVLGPDLIPCEACGEKIPYNGVAEHCREAGDPLHMALEVMGT